LSTNSVIMAKTYVSTKCGASINALEGSTVVSYKYVKRAPDKIVRMQQDIIKKLADFFFKADSAVIAAGTIATQVSMVSLAINGVCLSDGLSPA